jgi:hypothetical protein
MWIAIGAITGGTTGMTATCTVIIAMITGADLQLFARSGTLRHWPSLTRAT